MSDPKGPAAPKRPIPYLRWWIGVLLFIVTFINYVDRQTLSALSPYLKEQYGWSQGDYAFVVNAFNISYTVMQSVVGRLLDVFGTRLGIGVSVAFYSLMGALTAIAGGKYSFAAFRFLLGAGEAANNPGGAKAVSEWFPVKERAWAVGLYNSGCAIGGRVAAGGVWPVAAGASQHWGVRDGGAACHIPCWRRLGAGCGGLPCRLLCEYCLQVALLGLLSFIVFFIDHKELPTRLGEFLFWTTRSSPPGWVSDTY